MKRKRKEIKIIKKTNEDKIRKKNKSRQDDEEKQKKTR